jgi:outer membrane protein assembly factor BamE
MDRLVPVLRHHNMPKPLALTTYLATLFLAGCSWFGNLIPSPYTLDINQGNIVSQEMVDQLRPGMTKRQVAFVMGTPLLTDPFHDSRWDYLYSVEPDGEPRMQKNITLVFEGDELVGLQGDFRPGSLPSIDNLKDNTVIVPKIERERTLWEMLTGVFGGDD